MGDKSKRAAEKKSYQAAIQLIEGVALGMGFDVADDCIDAGVDLMTQMDAAYVLIQDKSAISMAKAMKIIAFALEKDMAPASTACGATKDEMEKLFESLDIMEHPKQFVYHMGHDLVVNGIDIYKQINESVAYYSTQDWKKMGESIGEALDLIIVGTGKRAPQPEMYV